MSEGQNDDFRAFVPNVHFELIPARNLVSNQDYQRNLSTAHVHRTVDNFDLYQINPVKVSRRDGINYVFDGQHTIETVVERSGSRDTPVWCMIYDDLDYETEADIFANQMKFKKPLTPYEIFMANIEAKNEVQETIKSVVESYQLTIVNNGTQNGICAVAALEYIYNKYGFHVLDHTLYLCVATWEGNDVSLSANMLRGIARLLNCYGDALQMDAFIERLGRISAKEITRMAKERRNGSLGFAETMLQLYNKRAKYRLDYSKLYDSRTRHYMMMDDDAEEQDETNEQESDDQEAIQKPISAGSEQNGSLENVENAERALQSNSDN